MHHQTDSQTLFLSHGGGPMPLFGESSHNELVTCLTDIATKLHKPDAIVIVSAHWEESITAINANSAPELLYDYSGFPKETYQITYPCQSAPKLASKISDCLHLAGLPSRQEFTRGYDHGVFVPLKIMFPEADIPVVQISLVQSLDAKTHLNIGRALQKLRNENILLIGSGFSFHNMRAFSEPDTEVTRNKNLAFEHWLNETCGSKNLMESQRAERLVDWQHAPSAAYCHPRAEHLLPLHVCYGFAEAAASEVINLSVMNKQCSMYVW